MTRHARGSRAYHGTADRRPLRLPAWLADAALLIAAVALAYLTAIALGG